MPESGLAWAVAWARMIRSIMLEIRHAQFQAFCEHAEKDFRRKLRVQLRQVIAEEDMSDAVIDDNIDSGIRHARDCRITREIDVARFVEAVCTRLGGFPPEGLPKPALPILYAYGVSAGRRIVNFVSWCDSRHGR